MRPEMSLVRGIFVGMSTVDVVHYVEEFPAPNTKVVASAQLVFAGGPACNAAVTFSHLGGAATLVTAVGRHPLTHIVRGDLQAHSVELVDINPEFAEAPVVSSIHVNAAGERNIVSVNAAHITVPSARVEAHTLEGASVLLVDGHYMQACQAWAAAAHARGIAVVLDGGSWKPGTDELLKSVDAAICSADFLPPGCRGSDDVLGFLVGRGIKDAAITNGAQPIVFASGGARGEVKVPDLEAVDTMGAGDIFHGAFCYFRAIGLAFEQALREAATVAAQSCRFRGTRQWMEQTGGEPR